MQDPRATLALVARVRKVRQRLRQCLSGETEVASSSLSAGQAAPGAIGQAHRQALLLLNNKLKDLSAVDDEFRKLQLRRSKEPDDVARSKHNAASNRYFDALPYDFNRVILKEGDLDVIPEDGYINASHLSSQHGEQPSWRYIAAQAPVEKTIPHFWAMVWAQKSAAILMLTQEVENGFRKAHTYIPDVGHEADYGGIAVLVQTSEQIGRDIIHRRITIARGAVARDVDHYQYHAWPDRGVPTSTWPLRQLARLLDDTDAHAAGPAIVHCSAGIGRTGTFCAVDIELRRLRAMHPSDITSAPQIIEVYDLVGQLRKQRPGMVQTTPQFLFIFRALQEELMEATSGQVAAGGTGAKVALLPKGRITSTELKYSSMTKNAPTATTGQERVSPDGRSMTQKPNEERLQHIARPSSQSQG